MPLILACRGGSPGLSLVLGYASGFLVSLGTFYWIFEYPGLRIYHVLLPAAYLALYPALWYAALPLLRRSSFASLAGAAGLWVGLDYLRANVGFLAISWATLAQSRHADLPLLQSAEPLPFSGPAGGSVFRDLRRARCYNYRSLPILSDAFWLGDNSAG